MTELEVNESWPLVSRYHFQFRDKICWKLSWWACWARNVCLRYDPLNNNKLVLSNTFSIGRKIKVIYIGIVHCLEYRILWFLKCDWCSRSRCRSPLFKVQINLIWHYVLNHFVLLSSARLNGKDTNLHLLKIKRSLRFNFESSTTNVECQFLLETRSGLFCFRLCFGF